MIGYIFKLFANLKYLYVVVLGKLLGISFVVGYLRNPDPLITKRILIKYGAIIGDRTTFKRCVYIDNSFEDQNSTYDFSNLIIGNNCYVGDGVYFDLSNRIILEDNVVISGQVSFVTHSDCNRSKYLSSIFIRKCEPLIIKNGSWIGFRATVLSGVTVAENTVVASCSLINKCIESKSVYAGTPARKIKNI